MTQTLPKRIRAVRIAPIDALVRYGADGAVYLQSPHPLAAYPRKITERLEYWAERAPDRPFLAQRDETGPAKAGHYVREQDVGEPDVREPDVREPDVREPDVREPDVRSVRLQADLTPGGWRTVSYAQALTRVRHLSQALLDRKLSNERPIVILSGNSIEHALLALAAMYTGVLYTPVAPAYSLQAHDYGTLGQIFERVRPALVFAAEGASYDRALRSVLPTGVELVVSSSSPAGMSATPFAELESTPPTAAVDEAHARVGPDTIGKILFTSGSTGRPKGVLNTQRMLCANQQMIQSVLACLADDPPVLCDWLPWNHTAGGNHNFGLVLYNGGTMYIDEGRPTPAGIETTVRNLREIAATAHFTVPRTYEMLVPYLRSDTALRERFFSKLTLLFYAAAGLTERLFDELRDLAVQTCGEEILWMTGLGATETAPFALSTGPDGASAGFLGLPAPGMELKLAPVGSKMEARVRGPNVTPGYWADEALTRAAFDEEGFYRLGDAMRFVDPADPAKGLLFDGRLAEDFKLSTGTWVSVGPLRARVLAHAAGYLQDIVIAGHDRSVVAALMFPNLTMCRTLCPELAADGPARTVLDDPRVRERFQALLADLARESTGSSTSIARAMLVDDPPSIDAREITDKGSLNQKAVLQHRSALVEELYDAQPSARVIAV